MVKVPSGAVVREVKLAEINRCPAWRDEPEGVTVIISPGILVVSGRSVEDILEAVAVPVVNIQRVRGSDFGALSRRP